MGSIWKAVTGFFKSKSTEMDSNVAEENEINDGSDSDDEDFVPNGAEEAPDSEISDDGDEETQDKKTGRKPKKNGNVRSGRKRKGGRKVVNGKKRRRMGDDPDDSEDDDEDDEDFVINESPEKSVQEVETPNPENVAAVEALEKEHTDRLWADFLSSVNEDAKRKKERTIEKVVTKVVDFAGEKVEVQQKVKVTVSSDSKRNNSTIVNNMQNGNDSKSSNCTKSSEVSNNEKTVDETNEPTPGPSSKVDDVKKPQPYRPRRGGISILGNDPEAIGLDELDKRGLSGLLKAFQNKARSTKIGTLEKSKLDWETYKRQQGMEEELQLHNKSRSTYIDKQEFLQRTDYRQFEIEKGMRATARSRRLANN